MFQKIKLLLKLNNERANYLYIKSLQIMFLLQKDHDKAYSIEILKGKIKKD